MDPLLTQEQAAALTSQHHPLYRDAHKVARDWYWNDLRVDSPDQFVAMTPSARAININVRVVDHVRRHGTAPVENLNGLPAQLLRGDDGSVALVRFKLLDSNMQHRNHQSGQQDDLAAHDFDDELMGQLSMHGIYVPPTVLYVGYQLTLAQDDILRVLVVSRHNGDLRFWYDVDDDMASGGTVVQLPGMPPETPRVSSKRRREEEGPSDSDPVSE